MTTETTALDQALTASEKLSPGDQLRLIGLLSERLRHAVEGADEPVDLLSLAGLGAELWEQVDVETYLEQERAGWAD